MEKLPARVVNAAAARRRFGPLADDVLPALERTDPIADAVIEDFAQLPAGRGFRMLETALREGIGAVPDAPASLRAFFDDVDRMPAWVEPVRWWGAGRLFFRSNAAGGIVLGAKSLALGYCSPAGNKPLVMTGRLDADVGLRLAETSRFVQAVCSTGGMLRDGEGFAITVKVRVMHAQVRYLLRQTGRWRNEWWGAPINQHDMLATTLLFSLVFLDGIQQFGVSVDPEELEDYLHLWRYVGYVMGVEEGLLPTNLDEARRSADLIFATQGPPDDDSRALVQRLLSAPKQHAVTDEQKKEADRQVKLGHGFMRALLGDELADQLELQNDRFRYLVPALRPCVLGAEKLRRRVRVVDYAARRAGERYWEVAARQGAPHRFVMPVRLSGA